MRKFRHIFALIAAILITNFSFGQDLFFSEYIEGSGSNKALEIYNPTGAEVDLHDYVIRINSNGSDWTSFFDFPEGTMLPANDVYVMAHAEADAAILAVADTAIINPYSGGTSYLTVFNGDDVRGLHKVVGTDTTLIDIIGLLNMIDPGPGWAVAGVVPATQDHTLVRKGSIINGNTDWTASAGTNADDSEWIVLDKDDFSNIGIWGVPEIPEILIITQYYEGTSNNKYIEITNIGTTEIDLSTYYLARWSGTDAPADDAAASNSGQLSGTIAVGETQIYKNAGAVEPAYAADAATGDTEATYFNGDDPVAITKDGLTWGDRVDCIYGSLANGKWGEDVVFVRKPDVKTGNLDMSVLDGTGEWVTATFDEVADAPELFNAYLGYFGEDVYDIVFFEDFSGDTHNFTTQSIVGDQEWAVGSYSGVSYMKMSGYSSGSSNENEDWLITPALDMDASTNEKFSFKSAMNYGSAGDGSLTVWVSEDFDGTSAPSTATWTELTVALSEGSFNWVESGDLDFSAYTGTIYVAFKYLSTAESSATWEITNVLLEGLIIQNIPPEVTTVWTSPEKPLPAEEVTVMANVIDENLQTVAAFWGTSTDAMTNELTMEESTETAGMFTATTAIPAHDLGTTIHYKVIATDTEGETGELASTYTVTNEVSILFEDFAGDTHDFTTQSIVGDQEWAVSTYSGVSFMKMSGYSSGSSNENEDWLITPALDMDVYDNEVFSFKSAMNYGAAGDGSLTVWVSEDFDGTSAPSTATWTELTVALSEGSFNWVESGDLDFSAYTGTIYVAFKYLSTAESSATWEITDVSLVGTLIENTAPTDITLSATEVAENADSGTVVGDFSATDADEGDTFTFELVAGDGTNDADNDKFAIEGNQLKTAAVFDFETQPTLAINVRVTDAAGATFDKAFTITVTDVDETGIDALQAMGIQVFPNPVNDILTIQRTDSESVNVRLFNSTGVLVMHNQKLTTNQLNMNTYAPGVYYLWIQNGNSIAKTKLVIK